MGKRLSLMQMLRPGGEVAQAMRARPGQIIDVDTSVDGTSYVHTFADGTTSTSRGINRQHFTYEDIGGWTSYRTHYEQGITNFKLDQLARGLSGARVSAQCPGCGARSWMRGRCRYCGGDQICLKVV